MAKRNEKTVLFLCTGNYYRSRFAEILFNSVASKLGLPWQASSSTFFDTRLGPCVPGSSSLKHNRNRRPPGFNTVANPST